MAYRQKKNKDTGFTNTTCNLCGVEAHTKAGKEHRRCGGSEGAEIRPKHDKLSPSKRGKWS